VRAKHSVVDHIEEVLSGVFFASVLLLVLVQIFCRYILNSPLTWSEELARYLFVWVVFLGASTAIKSRSHTRFSLLLQRLPERGQRILVIVGNMSLLPFLAILIYQGSHLAVRGLEVRTPGLGIPFFFVAVSLPACAALMLLRGLWVLAQDLRKLLVDVS
jgi:TRAP-type C4-dicarboxylate transport system permease small subunit